jgi:hypothetical protein
MRLSVLLLIAMLFCIEMAGGQNNRRILYTECISDSTGYHMIVHYAPEQIYHPPQLTAIPLDSIYKHARIIKRKRTFIKSLF